MKRAVSVVMLLAVAAGAAWYFGRPAPKPGVVVDEGSDASPAEADRAPAELAAGPASARDVRAKAARATGTSQLTGVVRHDGAPGAARVEAHYLMPADGNPFTRMRGGGYFQRLMAAPPTTRDAAATARAGDDGRFAMDGLGAGMYELIADSDDGARGSTMVTVPIDGARVEANIDVDGGKETLSGRVVHADGSPWSGTVLVEAWSGRQGGFKMGFTGGSLVVRADATGAFEARGLKAGEAMVTAIEPGVFRASSAAIALPRAEVFVLTIDAALAPVKGRIVADADGSPVAGATVTAGGQGGDYSVFVAQANAGPDGMFEVRVPAGTQSGFTVTAESFAPQMRQLREFKAGEPIEVRLVKAAHVVGRVTRVADGTPVASASVRVSPIEPGRNVMAPADPATTDADGRYDVSEAPAGEVMVLAEAPGLVTKGAAEVKGQGFNPLATTVKPGETTTVDIVMVPGAKVSGRVTDAAGQPVRGAVVLATPTANDPMRGFRQDGLNQGPKAATSADGAFSIEALVPGQVYALTADCAGYATARAEPFTASEATPVVLSLAFAATRMVDVSVLDDATGTGIAGARVSATPMQGKNGGFGRGMSSAGTGVTGADGRVRLGPVEAGDLRLDAQSDDYVRNVGGRDAPKVAAGETSAVVRLRRGLPIAGKVRLPDGSPAVGAMVQVVWDGSGARGWVQPSTTGADGAFRMRGVLAGTVKLTASFTREAKSYAANASVTVGAEDVVLTLAEGSTGKGGDTGQLVVRVLDADGKPVPSASALLRSKQGNTHSTNVTDGRVSLGRAAGEAGTLQIWAAKGRDGQTLNLAPLRREISKDETDIEVRLAPGLSIEGVVRSPEGAGIRGVRVSARPSAKAVKDVDFGDNSYGAHATARTDAAGAFRLDGLSDDDYALAVDAAAEFAPYDGPAVHAGAKGVEIALKAGLAAVVTVLDAAGKSLAGARVMVRIEEASETGRRPAGRIEARSVVSDATGVARVTGLASGLVYRLVVVASEHRQFDQAPWAPADTIVRLARAYTVSGVVKDGTGKPVARALVQWSTEKIGGGGNASQTGEDGRFKLEGLEAGDVYLRAQLGWGSPSAPGQPEPERLRVQAGASDVVLVVDVGLELVVRIENWPADGPGWHQPQLTVEGPHPRNLEFDDRRVEPDGVVRFRGLRENETYRLWIPPLPNGLSCLATGLRVGSGETKVRLAPGKTITGRLTAPDGADNLQVSASGAGIGAMGKVESDGRFTIEGLPDGAYDVQGHAQKDGGWWMATGKASAGGSVDLELKKR
jgi:protocatechuate 3,4-dioxygenase beta subunit